MIQKPAFEAIAPSFGHSFTFQKFNESNENKNNGWHYHPELELVYVNGGFWKKADWEPCFLLQERGPYINRVQFATLWIYGQADRQ